MDTLGARVREARARQGMTMSDLARATSLSPGAVSRIEAGERTPGSATVARLAVALGVEAGHLLTGNGGPAPVAQPQPKVDGDVLEAIQMIARTMPSLPPAGQRRVLLIIKAALASTVVVLVT